MPFLGVQPARRDIFQPQPGSDIGVNDAHAWRLNPAHRHIYNKLDIALDQGLRAAPCGVAPTDHGIRPDETVFVKPITNLAGMSLNARNEPACDIPSEPGSFWCEQLSGAQTSTDCLVDNGEIRWLAHTAAAEQQHRNRPLWWHIGVSSPATEPVIAAWVARQLRGYTGLCNLELIGGHIIEAHLRGSNSFFDFYGRDFIASWGSLVDHHTWRDPGPVTGGCVASLFGAPGTELPSSTAELARKLGVTISNDQYTADRIAIIKAHSLQQAQHALNKLTELL